MFVRPALIQSASISGQFPARKLQVSASCASRIGAGMRRKVAGEKLMQSFTKFYLTFICPWLKKAISSFKSSYYEVK
jgi:hypothetical protein